MFKFSLWFSDRKVCCNSLVTLFGNEGKHGGQATLDAVQLISNQVKEHDCQLHSDSVEVLKMLFAQIVF